MNGVTAHGEKHFEAHIVAQLKKQGWLIGFGDPRLENLAALEPATMSPPVTNIAAANSRGPALMKTTIRFIHAADIHLDSPLRGLDACEGMPADAGRQSRCRI